MKKLFFVSTNDWVPSGGSEVLWSKSALLLKQQGYDVTIYVKKWVPRPKHIEALKIAGCHLIEWESQIKFPPFFKRLANRFLPIKAQFQNESNPLLALEDIKPDLVILSLGDHMEGSMWTNLCIDRNIPYKIIAQLVKEAVWPADGDHVNSVRKGYMLARTVYFVSKDNKDIMSKQFAFDFPNGEIVYNPFFIGDNNPIPYPEEEQVYKLAFIASLNANHKGHDLLFEIMNSEKWRNRPIEINLYGKGPHEQQLKLLKEHWNLKNIHFCGYSDNIVSMWNNNHGLILCSRMEGQSLALLEAMFCGRTAIVTNVGGAKDLIDHGVNGFIAKAPTVQFIDEAMEEAWEQRNNWKNIGIKAYEKIRHLSNEDPVKVFAEKLVKE
ncbi:MAG: glycosyltransferase [Opitutaceae bacterium]|nr:glycosyltransferase [Cytophagales bacterium]